MLIEIRTLKYTDEERLNFLQQLLEKSNYTNKCICRQSTTDRGFRLHESSKTGSVTSVREAIDMFMDQELEVE